MIIKSSGDAMAGNILPGMAAQTGILRGVKRSGQTVAKTAFFCCAAPVVALVACRVALLNRRCELDELAGRLRRARPLPAVLRRRPEWWLATVERLLPLLPPWRLGPCFKRSLLLLDLWSRCGLEPRLHLSVRRVAEQGQRPEGHAWVTTGDGPGAPATSSLGYPAAFEL